MKKLLFILFASLAVFAACNDKADSKTGDNGSSIKLPYEATYSSNFTSNVSDSDLLLVLNSYKYWENGDLKALRTTMGDSMYVNASNGFVFAGLTDTLMKTWVSQRDSLSSVKITMSAWVKSHSVKDTADFITTWYKEIDTYKTGRVDSANYADINGLKNGKINWFSSYKQKLKL